MQESFWWWQCSYIYIDIIPFFSRLYIQSSGAVSMSRWTSWAPVPNKATVSMDVKQHFDYHFHTPSHLPFLVPNKPYGFWFLCTMFYFHVNNRKRPVLWILVPCAFSGSPCQRMSFSSFRLSEARKGCYCPYTDVGSGVQVTDVHVYIRRFFGNKRGRNLYAVLHRVQARSRGGRWCWTLKLAQKRSWAGRRSSDERHFNVSVRSDGQSHKTVSTNHNLFEEKGEPKWYPTEVLPLTSLPPYR